MSDERRKELEKEKEYLLKFGYSPEWYSKVLSNNRDYLSKQISRMLRTTIVGAIISMLGYAIFLVAGSYERNSLYAIATFFFGVGMVFVTKICEITLENKTGKITKKVTDQQNAITGWKVQERINDIEDELEDLLLKTPD